MELDEIAELVCEIAAHPLVKRRAGKYWRTPIVADGRGRRRAGSYGGEVTFPRHTRKRWVVLHEMAHEIETERGGRVNASHGPEFCGTYLFLVELFIGFAAREQLGKEMRARRVKVRP
jgi:putative metallohydrolase (TIGR04338 family)